LELKDSDVIKSYKNINNNSNNIEQKINISSEKHQDVINTLVAM
jgi:hypothetical protein